MAVVELLQELIRIDTTNPPGNEGPAAELLEAHLSAGGLQTKVYTSPDGRPNLVARLPGRSDRPALVLLSHLDVVGVEHDSWTHDPFGGEIADGYIWGRGALDMKGIAAMHAEAAIALARSDAGTERDVIVVSVADEEAGGREGARWLTEEHPEVFGFEDGKPAPEALGEGAYGLIGILDRPIMPIVVGEKSALWARLEARGDPGHGAFPPKNQATLNLARAINAVTGYGTPRVHEVMRRQFTELAPHAPQPLASALRLLASPARDVVARAAAELLRSRPTIGGLLADSVATTQIEAGYKHNVVPGEATASLDCRLLPDTDIDDFIASMQKRVGRHDVRVVEVGRNGGPVSEEGPLFEILSERSRALEPEPIVVPSLTSGMTDLRFLRAKGARAYGWVPLSLGPELLATVHGHDERVGVAELETAATAIAEVLTRAAG